MHHKQIIILDFDGTIFRLFANYDLGAISATAYRILKEYEVDFGENDNIFASFSAISCSRLAFPLKQELLEKMDELLSKAELEAIETGIPVNGFSEFIAWAKERNVRLAIASNNSKKCIDAFINRYCKELRLPVIGRSGTHPERMKPNTFMLEELCRVLQCNREDVLFIGDNARDHECAKNFGCDFVGLTPTLEKRDKMLKRVPNVKAVNDFFQLIDLLLSTQK